MTRVLNDFWNKKWDWDFTSSKIDYWEGFGIYLLLTLTLIVALALTPRHAHVAVAIIGVVGIFWLFVVQLGMTSLSVRRAHDVGLSGAWVFIPFTWFFIGFLETKTEDNKFRASGIKCRQGHDQFIDSIWCVNCQIEGFDAKLEPLVQH